MTEKTYHLVVTSPAGATKGSPALSRDAAFAAFETVHRAPGFLPDGGGRARVVDTREWAAIRARAGRRPS